MGEERLPVWKSYLYQLQQQAPQPVCVACQRQLPNRPSFYGPEFHGAISREDTDRLLHCDGCYLVRESQRAPGTYTLAIRFESNTKNFKLYYDGQHYVGEKRFDNINDLVADGLITFYLESKAADYIAALSSHSNYEESPYLAYNTAKKQRAQATRSRNHVKRRLVNETAQANAVTQEISTLGTDSVDAVPTSDQVKQYEKPHVFKTHNFKGPHWCDFCANFLWGLIAQGVKCQDCGFQAHKKCSEKVPHDCLPDVKYVKRVFGTDLTTLVKTHQRHVPVVVERCIKEIENRGLSAEGLYRVAGFHDDVEAIKMAFDKDVENADISSKKYDDINTIGSVLKLYFRLLPIPLLTFETYPKFLEAVKKEGISASERLQVVKCAVNLLPPSHYHTLKFLMKHLQKVTEKKSVNMMGPENLATVFAPTLLRSPDSDPLASLTAVKYEREVMELLITHQEALFDKRSVGND
ncbi:N-chimaerin [Lingula anatina]|uniref:Beta-chimaerin n=1 Tax=Lingula anatina TaxID=7574 RepID=A0A1S3IB46_LINAN|nr:N-chimaerin [Lingula anatina]|eukprot:XP_013395393.1 N-chimaerin [Lingula anatina]